MFMTLRRLAPIAERADADTATFQDIGAYLGALTQRRNERGPSKLARRLTRKVSLGRCGAH